MAVFSAVYRALYTGPVGGGEQTKLVNAVLAGNFAVARTGIYFIPPVEMSGRSSIQFYELSTGRTKLVASIENPSTTSSLSVSPDARSLIYTRVDEDESDLMLVDNFQ